MKYTKRNDDAPHQIRLFFRKHPETRSVNVAVSCTCQALPKGGSYDPMGYVHGDESPWPIYNNPDNHNHQREVFRAEEIIIYQSGVDEAKANGQATPEVLAELVDVYVGCEVTRQPRLDSNVFPLRDAGGRWG